ncbi:MAG: hypothetical protein RMJ18_00540 [Candidatus Aenigmarchaeota archaeon]|nr:hypothetical protein [Candidatus Aenigmarchaeota archaeon]MCX8190896.1 hypothetical protein [Candidatus Aenigmarchaeota archaeon]MDW8159899.1 hypothetical protein [Candidatus Aenigmarchaeota archaeon]
MKRVIRCSPTRVIKFIDGFGNRRIFVKGIGSFLEDEVIIETFNQQKKLNDFTKYYGW